MLLKGMEQKAPVWLGWLDSELLASCICLPSKSITVLQMCAVLPAFPVGVGKQPQIHMLLW